LESRDRWSPKSKTSQNARTIAVLGILCYYEDSMSIIAQSLSREVVDRLCRKWKVRELALFGSVLRDDFRPDSDVDVLVTFQDDAPWSLWDLLDMRAELQELFGREIDLVEERSLHNPFRRRSILRSKEVIYAA
jgi:uncharacterized protein